MQLYTGAADLGQYYAMQFVVILLTLVEIVGKSCSTLNAIDMIYLSYDGKSKQDHSFLYSISEFQSVVYIYSVQLTWD